MKTAPQVLSLTTLAAVLAACGGSASDTPQRQDRQLASSAVSAATRQAPAAYTDLVQRIYLGFFGRPADPDGLAFWSQTFSASGMPTTINGVIAAYPTNVRVRELIESFAKNEESLALYEGNTAVFVNSVYVQLFNRNAEPAVRTFWGGFIDRNEMTRAEAILRLLDGALNGDAVVLSAKVAAATYFTAELDTPQEIVAYSTNDIRQAARDLLATITPAPDIDAIKSEISVFMLDLQGEWIDRITRYVGFNFLQNQQSSAGANLPAYNARYGFKTRETNVAAEGELSYGAGTPKTIRWKRLGPGVLSYAAPITANASLAGNQILPALTMLCQPQLVAQSTSTDVLVARSARNLVDASQVAGQTFNVRRENCDAPPSSDSVSFDADGNARYVSHGVALSIPAATVSALLSGTQSIDANDTRTTLSAYRYKRADGTFAYAIVELARPSVPTIIAAGSLVVWSQE